MRKGQKGFSLIELLIVVAIILIIAAIAIPSLLRSKIAANEASCVASLRTINTALVTYASNYPSVPAAGPNCGYPPNLSNLKPGNPAVATAADLLDSVLGAVNPIIKSGYNITYTEVGVDANGCGTTYTCTCVPQTVGTTGQRAFFTDQSGVLHFNTTGAAPLVTDPVLQ